MNGTTDVAPSPTLGWSPECDEILKKALTSDYEEQDWGKLRDIIVYKLNQNIASYISDPPPPPPPPVIPQIQTEPPPSSGENTEAQSPSGPAIATVKFPPFTPHDVSPIVRTEYNSHGREKTVLTEEEAREMKEGICKLLREFEDHPPFTIQRLCELVLKPRSHYKTAGKYLRAVERSILVTSAIDAFPVIPPSDPSTSGLTFSPAGSLREATTPLFSPIPFLHEDARRSRSRSPPVSPLLLATMRPTSLEPMGLGGSAATPAPVEGPVIGLVDELDDPKPGHLADRPHALTSTTSTPAESSTSASGAALSTEADAKPLFGGSLAERFVKGSDEGNGAGAANADDSMAVDEGDADKENVPK